MVNLILKIRRNKYVSNVKLNEADDAFGITYIKTSYKKVLA